MRQRKKRCQTFCGCKRRHSDLSSTRISAQSESLALGSWIMATYGIASTCANTVQIRYQYKNNRLSVYTLGEHSHENEIRKRGLKLEKASRLVEAVEVTPSSKDHALLISVLKS